MQCVIDFESAFHIAFFASTVQFKLKLQSSNNYGVSMLNFRQF